MYLEIIQKIDFLYLDLLQKCAALWAFLSCHAAYLENISQSEFLV